MFWVSNWRDKYLGACITFSTQILSLRGNITALQFYNPTHLIIYHVGIEVNL